MNRTDIVGRCVTRVLQTPWTAPIVYEGLGEGLFCTLVFELDSGTTFSMIDGEFMLPPLEDGEGDLLVPAEAIGDTTLEREYLGHDITEVVRSDVYLPQLCLVLANNTVIANFEDEMFGNRFLACNQSSLCQTIEGPFFTYWGKKEWSPGPQQPAASHELRYVEVILDFGDIDVPTTELCEKRAAALIVHRLDDGAIETSTHTLFCYLHDGVWKATFVTGETGTYRLRLVHPSLECTGRLEIDEIALSKLETRVTFSKPRPTSPTEWAVYATESAVVDALMEKFTEEQKAKCAEVQTD